jgi:BMFP domain-containing protein YqiC
MPTVMPTAVPPQAMNEEVAQMRAENEELRRRLAALEDALGREAAAQSGR